MLLSKLFCVNSSRGIVISVRSLEAQEAWKDSKEAVIYAKKKFGPISESAVVPADPEIADYKDFYIDINGKTYDLDDMVSSEDLESAVREIENNYGTDLEVIEDFERAEEYMNLSNDLGWKGWIPGVGLHEFHESKAKFALKDLELRFHGEKELAEELRDEYGDAWKKLIACAIVIPSTLFLAGWATDNLDLIGSAYLSLTGIWNYGEKIIGDHLDKMTESEKYQIE